MLDTILRQVEALIAQWQLALGDSVQVLLGGSLVSGLLILDDETKVIDVDVRFLTDDPTNEELRRKIETVTGLAYRKTIPVNDWPEGESLGVMIEGQLNVSTIPYPLDVEGCVRNHRYVGWHQYYQQVLTPEELAECRRQKVELRHDKQAYKAAKAEVRKEVERRCVARGIVTR